jgi:hypothetical protein
MARWYDDLTGESAYKQYYAPTVTETSSTSISIKIDDAGMVEIPQTYTFIIRRMKAVNDFTGNYPEQTFNESTNTKIVTGLVEKGLYLIKTRTSGTIGTGNTLERYYQLQGVEKDALKINAVGGNSYLQIVGGKETDSKYNVADKNFGAVQIPTLGSMTISYGNDKTFTAPAYYSSGPFHYSFGTSFIFPPLDYAAPQEAGLGFFLSSDKGSGYYILVATSGTAATRSTDPVRIIKVTGKQIKVLKTSQITSTSTLDTIYGGEFHTIDVKVKVGGSSNTDANRGTIEISAYVDGFKITATDKNFAATSKPSNSILTVTNKVGLVAASGTASFDYVYATSIDADTYDNQDLYNSYKGKYSNDYILTQYGDLSYVEGNADDDTAEFEDSYEEFGTTAREIIKKEASFSSGPAFPNNWNLGYNKNITILDQTYNNFDAKIFVLNNTSQPTLLADQELNLFELQGTTVGLAGEIIYKTDPESKYSVNEPIRYKSSWIQTEEDAKRLAEFIKSKTVSKSNNVSMTVFGNPLLSVGDIITVKYPYQKLTGNEKIIITSISQEYLDGLTTTITGRTI